MNFKYYAIKQGVLRFYVSHAPKHLVIVHVLFFILKRVKPIHPTIHKDLLSRIPLHDVGVELLPRIPYPLKQTPRIRGVNHAQGNRATDSIGLASDNLLNLPQSDHP